MIASSVVNGYRIPATSDDGIGNWGGQEEDVAYTIDRIYCRAAELSPAIDRSTYEGEQADREFGESLGDAWDWMGCDNLDEYTDEDVERAARRIAGFSC